MRTLDRAALLAVIVMAFGLRIFRLGAQELRGDEAFGYFFIKQPYAQIVGDTLALEEPHPVLSYFTQKTWLSMAGTSEFSLRMLGALFGVLAVALLFRLALVSKLPVRISILGAALLAVSPYAIWHAQDARMYSMSMALTLASTLLAVLWLRKESAGIGVGYLVVSLAALHTHYFAAFIVVAQSLAVAALWAGRRLSWRSVWHWALLQVVLWLLYAPWLLAVRGILTGYGGNGDSPGLTEALSRAVNVFASGETVPAWQGTVWVWIGTASVLLGTAALFASSRYRPAGWLFGLYLAVPVLAAWYGAQARPIFDERYLAAAAPPFYVLAASSLLPLARGWDGFSQTAPARFWGLGGAALVLALFAGSGSSLAHYYFDPTYSKSRGWRELAQALRLLSVCVPADNVRLAQNYPDPTLWYYFGDQPEHLVLPPLANDTVLAGAEVDQLAEDGVERVLFIAQPSTSWDADGIGESALRSEYTWAVTDTSTNWPIKVFLRPGSVAGGEPVAFENGAILRSVGIAPAKEISSTIVPGGLLAATLDWDLDASDAKEPLKVSVQLLDKDGQLVGQADRPLPPVAEQAGSGPVADSYGILVPHALPGGEYRVIAGLYRPDTGERIRTSTGADHVELGLVTLWSGDPSDCPGSLRESPEHD